MMACNQCEDLVKTCSEWQVDDNSTTQARPEALVFGSSPSEIFGRREKSCARRRAARRARRRLRSAHAQMPAATDDPSLSAEERDIAKRLAAYHRKIVSLRQPVLPEAITEGLEQADELSPLRINLITGSDSWCLDEQHDFLEQAICLSRQASCPVSFETHRSRSLFNPWLIPELLRAHPQLRLTADLSHWCVVSERLMTPDLKPIQAMAPHVDHIHARVGHDQGASVSDPFAVIWQEELRAHMSCWQLFASQVNTRRGPLTLTPEFGLDGYMPVDPENGQPLRPVLELNQRMASWLRNTSLP